MTGSNLRLIKLKNGLKAFDVGDAGDFTKFVCYATGKTVEPDVIGTMEGLKDCPIIGGAGRRRRRRGRRRRHLGARWGGGGGAAGARS